MRHHLFNQLIPTLAIKKQVNLHLVNSFFALSIASYYVGMYSMPKTLHWSKWRETIYTLKQSILSENPPSPNNTPFMATYSYVSPHYHPILLMGDVETTPSISVHPSTARLRATLRTNGLEAPPLSVRPERSPELVEGAVPKSKDESIREQNHLYPLDMKIPYSIPVDENMNEVHKIRSRLKAGMTAESVQTQQQPLPALHNHLIINAKNPKVVIPALSRDLLMGEVHNSANGISPSSLPVFSTSSATIDCPTLVSGGMPPSHTPPGLGDSIDSGLQEQSSNRLGSLSPDSEGLVMRASLRPASGTHELSASIPQEPLLDWESYMPNETINDLDPVLRMWLKILAPKETAVKPEEIRFRRALIETLLSKDFRSEIKDSWLFTHDVNTKARRLNFFESYIERAFGGTNIHSIEADELLQAIRFPRKLRIAVFREDDLVH